MFDRERPAVASNIPVKFIVIFEKSELAGGFVSNFIGIYPRIQIIVGTTDINSYPVAQSFGMIGFISPIALNTHYFKSDFIISSVFIFIFRRKIPVYSPLNLISGTLDFNCF